MEDLLDPLMYKCPLSDLHSGQQEVREGEEMAKQERPSHPCRCTLCCAAHTVWTEGITPGLACCPASLCTGWTASEPACAALGRLGRTASLPAKLSGSEYVFVFLLITPSRQICVFSLEGSIPLYIAKTLITNTIFFYSLDDSADKAHYFFFFKNLL